MRFEIVEITSIEPNERDKEVEIRLKAIDKTNSGIIWRETRSRQYGEEVPEVEKWIFAFVLKDGEWKWRGNPSGYDETELEFIEKTVLNHKAIKLKMLMYKQEFGFGLDS